MWCMYFYMHAELQLKSCPVNELVTSHVVALGECHACCLNWLAFYNFLASITWLSTLFWCMNSLKRLKVKLFPLRAIESIEEE